MNDSIDNNIEQEEPDGGLRVHGIYIPPAPPITYVAGDTVETRSIITHIVNNNFKSYAGRVVLGPFHKNYTCIIGPNGSGKSNVIDSMLFVFGCRASKIRSKKLSVLIHKSSAHKNINSCSVNVHFQTIKNLPGDNLEPIPGSDLVIGRTVFIDNTSFYTINNKKAQFKEVSDLLRSRGIDLSNNRFLILQGEVEQISMMKPRGENENQIGLLEYLEDIIGTTRFKQPLKEFQEKLDGLNDQKEGLLAKVTAAEEAVSAARPKMMAAVNYLQHDNMRIEITNAVLQKQIFDIETLAKEKRDELKRLTDTVTILEEKLKEVQAVSKTRESNVSKLSTEKVKVIQQREELRDKLNTVTKALNYSKEDLVFCNKNLDKNKENIEKEEKKMQKSLKIQLEAAEATKKLKDIEHELRIEVKTFEQEHTKVMEGLQFETLELQQRKSVLETHLIKANEKMESHLQKLNKAQAELDMYVRISKKEAESLKELEESLVKVKTTLKQKEEQLEVSTVKLRSDKELHKKKQNELVCLKQDEEAKAAELYANKTRLAEVSSTASAARSRNKVLNYIMQEKEKGVLPGVLGRLGDLAGIDSKYDCAISTACGQLDSIVVDTVSTAKNCVSQLKKTGVGRASFLALDQMAHLERQYTQPIKTPESVPRLFDLIKFEDKRVKCAFYFALRNTLVANNLEQAKRCAYGAQRFRVVTLSGEIIELSGTMSGGGNEKMTGRMGRSATVVSSSKEEEISQLQELINEQQTILNQVTANRTDCERLLETLGPQIDRLQIEIHTLIRDVEGLKLQLPVYKKSIKEQTAVVKANTLDPIKLKELECSVSKYTEVVNRVKNEPTKVAMEEEVKDINLKMKIMGEDRLSMIASKINSKQNELNLALGEISKRNASVKTAERNEQNSRERIITLNKDIEKLTDKIRDIENKISLTQSECDEIQGYVIKSETKLKELEAEIKEMKSNADQMSQELSDINLEIVNAKHSKDLVRKDVNSYDSKIQPFKKKLDELEAHAIMENTAPELEKYDSETLEGFDLDKLLFKETVVQEVLSAMNFDSEAIEDFKNKHNFHKSAVTEHDSHTKLRNSVRSAYQHIKSQRLTEFMTAFIQINYKLLEVYKMLTVSATICGDAELELVDSMDPFEGIIFTVRPPGKSWKQISNLSGGEKTLSSLALIFALHYYKPSPLYVMDEIDAALDFRNVTICGLYIKLRTQNTQFVIISLRTNMFEHAKRLIGIFKVNNCTNCIVINPSEYSTLPVSFAYRNGIQNQPASNGINFHSNSNGNRSELYNGHHSESSSGSSFHENNIVRNSDIGENEVNVETNHSDLTSNASSMSDSSLRSMEL